MRHRGEFFCGDFEAAMVKMDLLLIRHHGVAAINAPLIGVFEKMILRTILCPYGKKCHGDKGMKRQMKR